MGEGPASLFRLRRQVGLECGGACRRRRLGVTIGMMNGKNMEMVLCRVRFWFSLIIGEVLSN